jgi:hypothetical protein
MTKSLVWCSSWISSQGLLLVLSVSLFWQTSANEWCFRMDVLVGMETDGIRMESDSDNTFYHIFTRIWIRIRMFSNTNIKLMSRMRKRIRIFTRFGKQHLPIFFIGIFPLKNHVKTKVLVHNRDSSLIISYSYIFILIINHIMNKTINKYIF